MRQLEVVAVTYFKQLSEVDPFWIIWTPTPTYLLYVKEQRF